VKLVIIDYGAGNLRSVAKAVACLGQEGLVSSSGAELLAADAAIVPGVGAAADTMRNLQERGLVDPVREFIASGRPFLGVCMGLQALFTISEEGGQHPCLNILAGRVRRLPDGLKVPHMGWNRVWQRQHHPLLAGIVDGAYFYFVHSYYAEPQDPQIVVAETEYGVVFPAAVAAGNLMATQFHPEKSGEAGLHLYQNFLALGRGG